MATNDFSGTTDRRGFLGSIATGAATIGIAGITSPLGLHAEEISNTANPGDPEEMFKKIKGKHRIVFDVTQPHAIFPFAWPRVFLMTNEATGSPEKDCSVVVVLRHDAIPYAMEDRLWEKYKFGEMFKAQDPATNTPATHNPFWKPKPGAFKVPGIGEVAIGINELQSNGVLFCVCDAALTVYSAATAAKMEKDAAEIKKDWVAGLLPGITVVPSGVWALGRAQEKGCGYIFAG
jgi:intracellular sulfur oxidation DsrE/DsrF family protein